MKLLNNDPWGYLLQFESWDVVVTLKDGRTLIGYVEYAEDADAHDREEASIALWHDGDIRDIFAGDIKNIEPSSARQ